MVDSDSAQREGTHRMLRIMLSAVAGSSEKVPKLLLGVEILNTSCTTFGMVLDVQYDASMIGPRIVVDSFAAVGGSFLPRSKSIAGLEAAKDIYDLLSAPSSPLSSVFPCSSLLGHQ